MKLLLDECIDRRLIREFVGYDIIILKDVKNV